MGLDLISQIEASMNVFTKAEVKVARYVLENPRQVLHTSITDLAEGADVGDTTVFRFCKTLNLKGYQEFKMLLAQALTSKQSPADYGDQSHIDPEDGLKTVVGKTLAAANGAIHKTIDLIDYKQLSEVVDLLVCAERVLVCGAGTSLITALDVVNKFLRITPKFVCDNDSHQQAMSASLLDRNQVALVISFSGATKDMVQIAGLAKERGASVVSITRFAKSPLAALSDYILLCGANEDPFQGGSMSGKMSQLLLLDILYNEYFKRTYQLSSQRNQQAAVAVLEKLY